MKGYKEFVTPEKFLERRERNRKTAKNSYAKNPEKHRQYSRDYYWAHKDERLLYRKQWGLNNPEKVRANKVKNHHRNKHDPIWILKKRIGNGIRKAIREAGFRKHGKTAQILGCDFEFFRSYIEKQFLPGMTWENHHKNNPTGRWWELDHIIPISLGMTEADIYRLSHYTNFRPLWEPDNNKKSDILPCGTRARMLRKQKSLEKSSKI